MPMECHVTQPTLVVDARLSNGQPVTSGTSWTLESWPFMPEQARQQQEADQDKPKATERLYSQDGRLVVAPGMVLPESTDGLYTENQILGRATAPEPAAVDPSEPDTAQRRRVRRK